MGSLLLMLCAALAALTPETVEAQASHRVSSSISIDDRGVPVATKVGTGAPAYHPLRVLVNLRNGAPRDFLRAARST